MSVHIFSTPGELASGAARHIAGVINDAARPITLGLAGGGTPAATYSQLAVADIDWSDVTMWLGDERWVPHDHDDSNTRMAHEALADKVLGRLIAPDTAFGDPAESAASYSTQLASVFYEGRPDVVMLGVGDEGHTASLFPGTRALASTEDRYLANWVEDKSVWRLTASLPMLWSAREIIFLAQGESKADVLAQIIDRGHPYPAQLVAAGAETVRWMIDAAAASQLRSVPR